MTNCFRHFKALLKKNALLWVRTPACSAFEILAPVIMMIALWVIRLQVPTTSVDSEGMLGKNLPSWPGVGKKVGGTWDTSTASNNWVDSKVIPFANFTNYTVKRQKDGKIKDYDLGYDWHGPQFWFGSQCLKTFDWHRPRQASPYIGIIGNTTNITNSIEEYYHGILKI